MKALSIRQPWAWLIIHGGKDIENRNWPTKFRGEFLVHAAKGMTKEEYSSAKEYAFAAFGGCELRDFPEFDALERGGIVGVARIIDCISSSRSPWFMGDYGFVLRDARPVPFTPLRGQLGFFDVPENVFKKAA